MRNKRVSLKQQEDEFKTFNDTNNYEDTKKAQFYLGLKYHTKKNSESEYTLNGEIPQIIKSARIVSNQAKSK